MKFIGFEYKDSLVSDTQIKKLAQELEPEINRVKDALSSGYTTGYASLAAPTDKATLDRVRQVIDDKKSLNIKALFIVGIGGSNLGTVAIRQALFGCMHNQLSDDLKVYYADTVDSDYIQDLCTRARYFLNRGEPILLNIISKSGTTTETVANAQVFLKILIECYPQSFQDYVVVTTDKDSPLWLLAEQQGFTRLEIPQKIGGRYSVFSPVGLFPLGMMGVDLTTLLEGAYAAIVDGSDTAFENNHPARMAAIIYHLYTSGYIIHDLFLFSNELEGVGKWYRQLMGESIGKESLKDTTKANIGITPTVSIGSTDLHSVGQLYLGGPYDKSTTFICIETGQDTLEVPVIPGFDRLVKHIQGKELTTIMRAIEQGTRQAYSENKRPYMTLTLPKKNDYYVGQLLQLFMMQMIYLGYLLKVNPFDQPEVERYKIKTRKILADG
jgi:glucose-6-phosphate isomerase